MKTDSGNWQETVKEYLRHFCWCLIPPSKRHQEEEKHIIQPTGQEGAVEKLEDDSSRDEVSSQTIFSISLLASYFGQYTIYT